MDKDVLSRYKFDDVDEFKRRPELEAKGVLFGFPGGKKKRWMRIAAATENNPFWRAELDRIRKHLNELSAAEAPISVEKEYLAEKIAKLLIRDWGGWEADGVEIPFSTEAAFALLMSTDDIYQRIRGIMFNDANYRTERADLVLAEGKG